MEGNNPYVTAFDPTPKGMCRFLLSGFNRILRRAERYVGHLGLTSRQRNAAAVQIVQTRLIELGVSQRLPTAVAQRMASHHAQNERAGR